MQMTGALKWRTASTELAQLGVLN